MMKPVLILLLLLGIGPGIDSRKPEDCSWENKSKVRKAVKTRGTAVGSSYLNYKDGQPINLNEWYTLTCSLDAKVPQTIPADSAIEGAETIRVSLRGYLLAARFERDADHDIQVELGASPDWNTDHVLVELPPGDEFCEARRELWSILRSDGCKTDECLVRKPVEVIVTGYVMLGGTSTMPEYCHVPSTRGMRKGEEPSHLVGAWRLQPVFSDKKAWLLRTKKMIHEIRRTQFRGSSLL
jgi:hypothetical protein